MNFTTASARRLATVAAALVAAAILALSATCAHAADTAKLSGGEQLAETKALLEQKTAGRGAAKRPPGRRAKVTTPKRRALNGYTAISYCFRHTNGAAYTYDTSLQAYVNGAWHNITVQRPNINGCGTFYAPNGYYWRVRAYVRVVSTFSGVTGWRYAGGGSFHLGTWWVYG